MLEAVNVVVTMGCCDAGPILPGRRYDRGSFADIGEEAPASSPTSTTGGREAGLHCSDSAHQVKQTAGCPWDPHRMKRTLEVRLQAQSGRDPILARPHRAGEALAPCNRQVKVDNRCCPSDNSVLASVDSVAHRRGHSSSSSRETGHHGNRCRNRRSQNGCRERRPVPHARTCGRRHGIRYPIRLRGAFYDDPLFDH
jgi:hypothetical protein